MRPVLWNNLFSTRYKALYAYDCAKSSRNWGSVYSFFLSLTATSSVAAWAIWKEHPEVWAIVVAVAQVLHVAKPYLPFLKNETDFLEMSFEYDCLHLEYERIWNNFDSEKIDDSTVKDSILDLQRKQLEFENKYKGIYYPEGKRRANRVCQKTEVALSLNHAITLETKEKT